MRTADEAGGEQFPFVAFTAPPSQNSDYPAAVRTLAEHHRMGLAQSQEQRMAACLHAPAQV